MAIKERLLKQLNNVQDGLRAMPPFHSRDLQAMRNALLQARDLCFRGLSEKHFANYQDTYDGLLLAIDQLAAGAPDAGEIVSLCSELLQFMMMQTQKENAFKKEIFFLPYKASMWDSLESVWKAADKDKEHCIAYVMPIPYADLTPEHTAAEWHCERGLFPKYVPTVNWEEFDLQEIHPDVIYIHNPYDEYNRVTSVEGRYYSSVLKHQTDKLVYIPYFVLEEIIPGNEAAEEAISGFILAPAILNADKVIVQSEDMRQVYINVLIRNTNQKDRAYWEKRILGLGSPKIEKVLTSKKEDFELPESWAKIVKGKKVILYNTSLTAMLQNSDKVCEKLRYVFDVFKNRDDVALWWRPHPLMQATIHSMRPEIEKEYCQIERQYIKEGWGVYDDTGDLHRAIAWSDAYYGDRSSVVTLYKKTGKPVMVQNVFAVGSESGESWYKSGCTFLSACQVSEQRIVFFDSIHSAIMEYELNTGRTTIKKFLDCPFDISKIFYVDNELFFVAQFCAKIFVCDPSFRDTKEYEFGKYRNNYVPILYKKQIFGIPVGDKGVYYCFDCSNKKITQYMKIENEFKNNGISDERINYYIGEHNEVISFSFLHSNKYMIYDFLQEKSYIHSSKFNNLNNVLYDSKGIWMTKENSLDITYFDLESETYTEEVATENLNEDWNGSYSNIFVYDRWLVALPRKGKRIVLIDRISGESRFFIIPSDIVEQHASNSGSLMYGFYCTGKYIYLYPKVESMFAINLETMQLERKEFYFKESELIRNFAKCNEKHISILENGNELLAYLKWNTEM